MIGRERSEYAVLPLIRVTCRSIILSEQTPISDITSEKQDPVPNQTDIDIFLDLHNRPWQRNRLHSNRPPRRPHQGPHSRIPSRKLGQNMAPPCQRLATPLDRPRKGRHPPRSWCRGERHLGPVGKDPRQACLEDSRRHDSPADCRLD